MTRKRVVSRVVWWLLIVFVLFSSISVKAQSDQVGQWTTLTTLPFFPIHNHLLPTGKVMIWPGDTLLSGNDPRLWNPADQSVTMLAKPGYDIFCSGHAFLADGRLFVAGGHIQNGVGLANASLYNPFSNTWAAAPDMNAGRWYPTVTTLANGDALVVSGSIDNTVGVNTLPQVYETATGTWRSLTSAQLSQDLYPMMFLAPNGRVFHAGPLQITRYLDTSGTGAWSVVADHNFGGYRDYGSAVMYADGKILVVGGGDPPTNTAEVIDLNQPSPTWRSVAPMSIARRQLNATLLPDGTVLVTGGTSGPGFNDPTNPVYPAELWDPATESWRTLASATVPRLYHSAAILLPDGRVLTTGGNNYPTPEAFSPPYLFKGARPTMSAVPSTIGYGQPFSVQTPDAASITKVTLIRITSVTHAFNENQRLSVLGFTPGAGTLDIVAPATANVAPPGHYLLFIVNDNGVPSVGSIVQLGAAPGAATLTSLSPSSAVAGGPAFTLTVNGTGFVSGATVQWNGAARTTTFVSSTQLRAAIAASDIGVAGTRPVTVVNPGTSASNALTFTITTPPAGGSAALVAAYGFDEGTVPTTADLSGNGNTGVIGYATWTTSGKFGSALVFNGSSALVTIADAPELNLTTAMTLMAWVKPSAASTLFTDVIWKDYFAYFLEATSDTGAPGVGAFINSTAHVWVPAPSALTVDAWAHLAATYDGQNVRLYVNGVQVGISAQTGTIGTTPTLLRVGGSQYFSGVIDEVRIYNVALTQAQIQGDMNTPVGGAAPGAATLTSLSPSSAVAGGPAFTLTVTGTGFVNGATVQWNGAPRTTTFGSITQLTAAIPASDITAAATRQVTVVNPGAAASNPLTFTITAAAPPAATLTSLSPSSAVAGGPAFTLTVTGTGFVNGATVQWNGAPRTTTFGSITQLTAAIPASDITAAATRQVTVVNPGAAASNPLTFTITAAAPPAATLTSLSPSSAVAGGPAFTLTVTGTGFVNGATVQWNGAPRTTTFGSITQLTAAIPASDITAAATRQVTVVNPGAAASNPLTFTITAAAPPAATLTSLSPSSAVAGGPAFTLTVTGTGFVNGATVQWNGAPRTTTFGSITQLTAAIPASDITAAATRQITVVNPGAAASNPLTFTITAAAPAATLTSLSPSSAVAGGPAFTLTVTGTGFVNGATVQWNGAPRTTTFGSITQLTAAIPASDITAAATRQVTVVNPGAAASNPLTFTITPGGSPGLVAAYGFDEGTGSTTADLSGNGNTGTIADATWTTSGKFGSALVFNGSSALVTIADAPELNLTTAMTLMAWVKPSAASTLFTDVIWKDYFAYFLEATSDTGAPGVGAFINGTTHVWVPAPSALTVDAWAHLAATYDGQNVRLYVNGVQVGISAQTGTIGTTPTLLRVGGSQYFSGVIDEVRIYNVALTQAQIQGDMNTPVGGAAPGAATLTSLSPSSAVAGGPAFTLTVTGTGFVNGATVQWNGAPRTTTFGSITQLTAAIPASDITAAATRQVTVVNPGAAASNPLTFTITAAAPPAATLTSLSPSSAVAGGPAFTLTVTGTGFVNGATVQWNGAPRTTTFGSITQLTAAIPASDITAAATRQVTVVNPGAAASNPLTFTITTPPPASSFTLNVSKSGPGTVTSSPAGINCGADCSESYAAGTVVTLTATPNNNATFQGWGGAGSGTGARTVTMNADQSVTATFRKR